MEEYVAHNLVFIHGFALSSDAFKLSIKALSKGYNVIAPDLPGFGSSKALKQPYTYELLANYVEHILDERGIRDAHFVGQSMGGGICLTIAARSTQRVKSLILANSAGIPVPMGLHLLKRGFELPKQVLKTRFNQANWHMAASFFSNLVRQPVALPRVVRLPLFTDLRPILKDIRAPCLLAWGPHDCIVPLSSALEFQRHMPHAQLEIIPNGFHEWCAVYPEALVRAVKNFHASENVV